MTVPISVTQFIRRAQAIPDTDMLWTVQELSLWARRRDKGWKCGICGASPIWAVGSAQAGRAICFTCSTGEEDDSEDYDVVLD